MAGPSAVIGRITHNEIARVLAREVDIEGDGNGCRHLSTIGSAAYLGKARE